MEYDFGEQYYKCDSCGYREDAPIPWGGGNNLPKSNWWTVTKYPKSFWVESNKNLKLRIKELEDSIASCEKNIISNNQMIKELDK